MMYLHSNSQLRLYCQFNLDVKTQREYDTSLSPATPYDFLSFHKLHFQVSRCFYHVREWTSTFATFTCNTEWTMLWRTHLSMQQKISWTGVPGAKKRKFYCSNNKAEMSTKASNNPASESHSYTLQHMILMSWDSFFGSISSGLLPLFINFPFFTLIVA